VQVASMTSALGVLHLFELLPRHTVGADDEGPALDLVGEVGGANAAVGEVGLDPGVVHQLAEGGDLLPLGARVLRLVDREPNAVAEAGALRDPHIWSDCRCHGNHSTVSGPVYTYIPRTRQIRPGAGPAAATPRSST
jgi:hypothetical protein